MLSSKVGRSICGLIVIALWSMNVSAEYGINFPDPVTRVGKDIYDVHMLTMQIATWLMVIVLVFMVYILYTFRKSKGYEADQHFHRGWFGQWSWILVPAMVLVVDLTIAGSAQATLERFWNAPKQFCSEEGSDPDRCFDMNLKVIGHQWWWEYEYPEYGVEFEGEFYPLKIESRPTDEQTAGEHYLRDVDNPVVLPVGRTVRYLNTSADVLHAWWVPELGFKRDAIPGYIMETWAKIDEDKVGVYRGQCAELCGTWHSKMPVVINAVSGAEFDRWVEQEKATLLAALVEANADKVWSMEDLYSKGEAAYNTKCAACHKPDGSGLPPAFPPLKGSKIATGPVAEHIDIVLKGKGTMPPWGMLSDLELAALITYERNAWGNATGDVVQPSAIKAARQ